MNSGNDNYKLFYFKKIFLGLIIDTSKNLWTVRYDY